MKTAVLIVLIIHALIHGLGFWKASGLLWLVAALALILCGILLAASWSLWWTLALAAVALSQILVFQTWSEAKFGTIPNIFILAAALVAMGSWSFENHWQKLSRNLIQKAGPDAVRAVVTEDDIRGLPSPVQNWLRWSRVVGRPRIASVHLLQKGFMRLKPEQKDALRSVSEQLIAAHPPAFIWKVRTRMLGLPVLGRDMFDEGQGSMWISLLGLIPVVHVANNPKTNQSALQRFLGEVIWMPSAALHPAISWQGLDERRAEATMNWAGTRGSAVFYFEPDGRPTRFVAQRFKDVADDKPLEWVADIEAWREFDGVQMPSRVKATWMLPSGPFTWFEFEIDEAQFN